MSGRSVLLTGAAGAIGRVVGASLREAGHRVTGFDRRRGDGLDDFVVGDLAEPGAIAAAAAGCDRIIHLGGTPDEAPFDSDLVPNNVVGSYRVLQAALERRIPRVIIASTLRVVGDLLGAGAPVTAAMGTAPRDHYALSKAMVEQLGEMYARRFGLGVLCARIAWFLRDAREGAMMAPGGVPARSAYYLSHRDTCSFFRRAVEAEWNGFAALFVVSRDGAETVDLDAGRRVLGWEPGDRWPEGTPRAITGAPAA